jgi:PKD repeat protein
MLRRVLACLLVILLGLGLSAGARAATTTVSSVDQLRTAIAAAQPGDIIELTDGTYTWSDHSSLAEADDKPYLTIRSQSRNRDAVILQGLGQDDDTTQFIFKLYRSPHFTAEDMTLRDVYWHCVQVNDDSDYCTLRNLKMVNAGEGPVKVTSQGTSGPYSDYGVVENCELRYDTKGTRDVVEGIDIVAAVGWRITNCRFYNVTKGLTDDVAYAFFAKGNSQDTLVEGCYFEDCDIALSFGGGGTDPAYFRDGDLTYEHRRGIMRNNVVNRTLDVAIYMNTATDFEVYNNTLWSTFTGADSSIDVRFASSGTIVNNIASQSYHLRDGGQATESSNLWHATSTLFVDPTAGDYHLLSTAAAAVDQGADLSADVPYDLDGQPRPFGAAFDLGADEYTASAVPVAGFAATPASGLRALSVQVRDHAAGLPTGWSWDFGDGGTSALASPAHTYTAAGHYTVSLSVTNGLGSDSDAITDAVKVATFDDVLPEFWAWTQVEACVAAGIVHGYDDGRYHPADIVTRDQMAVFVARALAGGDANVLTPTGAATFADVPADYWAYKYVEYAKAHLVVNGYDATSYRPTLPADRGQMAVYMARMMVAPLGDAGLAGYTPPTTPRFTDVPTDFWAYLQIEYLADPARGVVHGYDGGAYHPEYAVSRDQMAVYVQRAQGLAW